MTRLARWAEPRQNRPRAPFRWVGYNGDANHGCGHHLHLSWSHAEVARYRIAPWVEVFRGAAGPGGAEPGHGGPSGGTSAGRVHLKPRPATGGIGPATEPGLAASADLVSGHGAQDPRGGPDRRGLPARSRLRLGGEKTPEACLDGPGAYTRALRGAPAEARLAGGIPISSCLTENQSAGDLTRVGAAMVAVATR